MTYSIFLLRNLCCPPQIEEGAESPKNQSNGKPALITDVVLASLAVMTGALALAAGTYHLGSLSFLGKLSQTWSISLISAGGGVILFELSAFSIKNCKKDTPEAPKSERPALPARSRKGREAQKEALEQAKSYHIDSRQTVDLTKLSLARTSDLAKGKLTKEGIDLDVAVTEVAELNRLLNQVDDQVLLKSDALQAIVDQGEKVRKIAVNMYEKCQDIKNGINIFDGVWQR